MISGANEEQLELANARADILLLQQENKKYKEVIDKAIEYIEKLNEIIPRFWFTKLLELLKEVK